MALRLLGSLVRGSSRAQSCFSSPGVAIQGALASSGALPGLRNAFFHRDGLNSPAAVSTLSAVAGSRAGFRGLHNRVAKRMGSHGDSRGLPGGGGVQAIGNFGAAVIWLTILGAFIFLRSDIADDDEHLPKSVDWSKIGAVTETRDQDECGNCWAHAVVGCIESSFYIETGKLVVLSVQQVTDCTRSCKGCGGGTLLKGFWYARSGICTESSYPQRSDLWHGPCCSEGLTPAVKICRFSITDGSEECLMRAVAKQPVAVRLDAHEALNHYTGGIISYNQWPTVEDPEAYHDVLVVGYDTDEFGVDFWKIKSSWGPDWGEEGYFRIRRGVPTKYGVAGIRKSYGVYPHFSWFGKKRGMENTANGVAVSVAQNGDVRRPDK